MDKIDATIGKSIRHYRWLQGISQSELAATLGVTETQLRSHEAGKSRVSAARLMAIAGILGVEVTAFFQRNPDQAAQPPAPETTRARPATDAVQNGKYLAALMTHFQRLNEGQKQAVLQLVMSISKEGAIPAPSDPCAKELVSAAGQAMGRRGGDGSY